ncbi:MAG: hypothetical protein IT334_07590 [Thermomicrobiales bacterium]|nr:hypothetical protein [Thermomicrobiales bacterium]
MDTYNIYMDETPASEFDDESFEIEFRVVQAGQDENDQDEAVIAGLDLIDLIYLRDALQQEIDNYALRSLEAAAALAEESLADEE